MSCSGKWFVRDTGMFCHFLQILIWDGFLISFIWWETYHVFSENIVRILCNSGGNYRVTKLNNFALALSALLNELGNTVSVVVSSRLMCVKNRLTNRILKFPTALMFWIVVKFRCLSRSHYWCDPYFSHALLVEKLHHSRTGGEMLTGRLISIYLP